MDPHPRSHHVLLQTSHSQVWSLGPADTRGAICTQGQDIKVLNAFTEILLAQPNFVNQVNWCQCQRRFIFYSKNVINCWPWTKSAFYNIYRLLLFTLAAEFTLYISYIPNPFHLAHYRICPWGELSLFSPCPRHTHTGRAITHVVTPAVTHINHIPPGGEQKHLELENVLKLRKVNWFISSILELISCPCTFSFLLPWSCPFSSFSSLPSFLIMLRWSEMSCC